MNLIARSLGVAVLALSCMPLPAQAQVQAPAQAQAQAQARVGDRFGNWVFECVALAEGKTACALTYAIVSKVDNRRVVQLSLGRNELKGGIVLTAFLPLGIHLPSGASGAIDQGKPFQYTLETCLPQRGCVGTYAVSGDFLKSLQGGQSLNIRFVAGGQQVVSVSAALNGLAEGIRAAKLN